MICLSDPPFKILTVLMLICGLAVSGCSASKTSVPLALPIESHEQWASTQPDQSNKHLIEIKSLSTGAKLSGFATAFKTCGYSDKTSLRGASRQFFVGLEKLEIQSQGPIEIGAERLWKVDANALNEGFPISLSTYTLKREECFVDFAFWVPKSSSVSDSPALLQEVTELQGIFSTLVAQMIPHI